MKLGKLLCLAKKTLAVAALALSCPQAQAAEGPITIVVGFAPGGVTDLLARIIGAELAKTTGQNVVIENRPGATSTIAAALVAKSRPDGRTLLFAGPGQVISPSIYKLRFAPVDAFQPVGMVASVPLVLSVTSSLPVHSVADLITYAKAHPNKLNFSSGGTSSLPRLAGELFKAKTGAKMTSVAYSGSGPALVDLEAGRVQLSFDQITTVLQGIKQGKLRALAVSSETRSPVLPDVPTMAQAGVKDYVVTSWNGLLAPAGTPSSIVSKLNQDLGRALAEPGVQEKFEQYGATPVTSTPEQLKAFMKSEIKQWAEVVKTAHIQVHQ